MKKYTIWWTPLKVPQEVYYYAFRIIQFFLSWREFVHHCLITNRFQLSRKREICYLNATIQILYRNVRFRKLIINFFYITWLLVWIRKTNIMFIIIQRSWCEVVTETFRCYIFRGGGNCYWFILYYGKYKDELLDVCRWIWGVIVYYLVRRTLQ